MKIYKISCKINLIATYFKLCYLYHTNDFFSNSFFKLKKFFDFFKIF